jgi:hypothetical protein
MKEWDRGQKVLRRRQPGVPTAVDRSDRLAGNHSGHLADGRSSPVVPGNETPGKAVGETPSEGLFYHCRRTTQLRSCSECSP